MITGQWGLMSANNFTLFPPVGNLKIMVRDKGVQKIIRRSTEFHSLKVPVCQATGMHGKQQYLVSMNPYYPLIVQVLKGKTVCTVVGTIELGKVGVDSGTCKSK